MMLLGEEVAVFIRTKHVSGHDYVQLVESRWEDGRSRQRVIATLGRLDQLQEKGQVEGWMRSLIRLSDKVSVQAAHAEGNLRALSVRHIGPEQVFGRLWEDCGLDVILHDLVKKRRFTFDVERAVFATVLHRLFESGSDRQGLRFLRDVAVSGTDDLELHHLYRAMRFLGENRDAVEERLFEKTKDLFSPLDLVFFDTTSLYFEGQGGEELGAYGHSKDHRPDRHQVVVGALLSESGRPLHCEIAPGNQTDVATLLPVVDRARERFGLSQVCFVADRGMVSAPVIEGLEERGLGYILGMRMRRVTEVREEVLSRAGRYETVAENLEVKEVWVNDRRYLVCHNPDEAKKDAADRAVILDALAQALHGGAGGLIANRGYRRYLTVAKGAVQIDPRKVKADVRFDGKWVLRTNTSLATAEVATQYKRLLIVEQFFRAAKSLLETRPIYHHYDATIAGHLFVSFLALVLRHELEQRLAKRGWKFEWQDIVRDLTAMDEVEVRHHRRRYLLRTPLPGVAGKVLQAVGVAIPPPVRETGRS
jgi:hypothetical protein